MVAMTPVPTDHPLMKAWEAHKATDAYANSRRWAMSDPKHVDGALWALFVAGWDAANSRATDGVEDGSPAQSKGGNCDA